MLRNMKFPTILYIIKRKCRPLWQDKSSFVMSFNFLEPLYCSESKDGKEFRGFITCRLLLRPKPNV